MEDIEEIEEEETSPATQVAEAILSCILILFALATIALGVKYYRMHQAKENYPIVQNNRQNSMISTVNVPEAMEYDNPAYGMGDNESSAAASNEAQGQESGAIQLDATCYGQRVQNEMH